MEVAAVRRRAGWRRRRIPKGFLAAAAFVAPAVAIVAGLTLYPLGFAALVSLFDYDLVTGQASFVGLDNFVGLLQGGFPHAALVTLVYTAVAVACELVLGVALALLLDRPALRRARGILLALLLTPLLAAPVVSGATVKMLLNPDVGLLARLLGHADVLGNASFALPTLIVMDVWMWTPFVALLVLAALAGVPSPMIEAARLDGANALQRFRYIVLPLLKPMLAVIVLLRVLDCVKVADIPYVMTQGGPGSATNLISLHVFRTSFGTFDIGLGAAMSVAVVLALMLPVLALRRATRPAVPEGR